MKIDCILSFIKENDTWYYVLKDIQDDIKIQIPHTPLIAEMNNKDYFDGWEAQIKGFPEYNVIEVYRFI